jgi:hypothetical protein
MLDRQIRDAEADYEAPGALRRRDEAQDELVIYFKHAPEASLLDLLFNRKNFILMTARNNYITEKAKTAYAQRFVEKSLSVFCVSNRDYSRNRRRVRVHDLPIQGSGIPSLRNHCHKIPAQAQFRIATHFLQVRLEDLVKRVQLWLVGGSQESLPNHATVQRLLEQFHNDIRQVLSSFTWKTLL